MSVPLLSPSSEMEATLNRRMSTAATTATETRNRIEALAKLALSVRSLNIDISPPLGSQLSGSISLAQAAVTRVDFRPTARAMTRKYFNERGRRLAAGSVLSGSRFAGCGRDRPEAKVALFTGARSVIGCGGYERQVGAIVLKKLAAAQ